MLYAILLLIVIGLLLPLLPIDQHIKTVIIVIVVVYVLIWLLGAIPAPWPRG
jgi:hypothetical protein